MKKLALILALAALPAHAGGPVIVEDTTETVAPDRDNGWVLPVLGLLVIGALIASGGGDDAPATEPGPKPCVKISGGGC